MDTRAGKQASRQAGRQAHAALNAIRREIPAMPVYACKCLCEGTMLPLRAVQVQAVSAPAKRFQ